jgi:hypothetical protein
MPLLSGLGELFLEEDIMDFRKNLGFKGAMFVESNLIRCSMLIYIFERFND